MFRSTIETLQLHSCFIVQDEDEVMSLKKSCQVNFPKSNKEKDGLANVTLLSYQTQYCS